MDEAKGWTREDWRQFTEEFVREMDRQPTALHRFKKGEPKRMHPVKPTNIANSQYFAGVHYDSKSGIPHLHMVVNRIDKDGNLNNDDDICERAMAAAHAINLRGSQYVVSLHRDSKIGILHLHINANRIDMKGNVNDAHFIYERAMAAAAKINQQRGWVDASVISQENKDAITIACHEVLQSLNRFDWRDYVAGVKEYGYQVELKRSKDGVVRGYTVAKGNSVYKSSELGKGRRLMPSKIMATWRLHHPEVTRKISTPSVTPTKPKAQPMPQQKPVASLSKPVTVMDTPKMHHFDFSTDEFHNYPVDISDKALNVINDTIRLDAENTFATIEGLQQTALLLFANYLNAATEIAATQGGGGGDGSDLKWGRDKDEDELSWAHRCAVQANKFCRSRKKIGISK